MKKIFLTTSLFALLIVMACETSKSRAVVTAPPSTPQAPATPQKTMLNESEVKATPIAEPYQKRSLPTKGRLQPTAAASATPDTIK